MHHAMSVTHVEFVSRSHDTDNQSIDRHQNDSMVA